MDAPQQANPQFHYKVNGQNSRLGEHGALSQDVQDCIQFFDDTIVSLEESLSEDDGKPGASSAPVGRSLTPNPLPGVSASSVLSRPLNPNQDIIDLVRPGPDLVQTKEPLFSPNSPDFQSVVGHSESHFEVKPWRDKMDHLPSEYNPPLPSGSYGSTDSSYHPPGCIPTPVLIAQQMAENQAGGASGLLRHRGSDSDKPPGANSDQPGKQGPPTSVKPNRFPANISVILGSKEHQNQSLANVNIHERQAQMLANLSGAPPPLPQEDLEHAADRKPRNTPTRSISFRDPTPNISRMEALSKLGLNRSRAMSGGTTQLPNPALPDTPPGAEAGDATSPPQRSYVDRRAEVLRTPSLRGPEERRPPPSPSSPSPSPPAATQRSFSPVESKAFAAPPPKVTSMELNSYGGKSIVVNPSVSSKSEAASSPTSPEPKGLPPGLAHLSEFNTYGGKSIVMNPAPQAVTRNNLPDILSSHITKSQTLPARSEAPPPPPIEPNSYGGKSRTINPSSGSTRPGEVPARSFKPLPPSTAPRPARHSYHAPAAPQKAEPRASTLDHKRKPASMFRPQGITVQFTGRGTSDESRKEALRKLGLMKES